MYKNLTKKINCRVRALVIVLASVPCCAYSNDSDICKLLKSEKAQVAYLIDEKGKISNGPIDYGRVVDDGKREEIVVPTMFKMLIYPKRIFIENNDCSSYGCLRLTKTKSLCPLVSTYDVSVRLIFRRKGEKFYNYIDDTEFFPLVISDPKEEGAPTLTYKFRTGLVGSVTNPLSRKD